MKRPDLRVPLAERQYAPVDKPHMVTGQHFGLPPAKEPCKECPLARTALPGQLGGYTVAQYVGVLNGPADLACHMSKGFPKNLAEQRSCTGVAMYRCNTKTLPMGANARSAMARVGPNRELAFATEEEFVQHHTIRK